MFGDPLPCFPCSQASPDVGCSSFLTNGLEHGGFDHLGFFMHAQVPEHHGRSKNRARGIRDVLSCDWWSRSVDGLEHRCLPRVNISAGGHTKAPLETCSEVRNDVAEH